MPPRKEKLTPAQLHELVRDYGIRMEGPVPPRHWPEQYKHHFQAVRTIEDLRYETYMYTNDSPIPSKQRNEYKSRVRELRNRVYKLLDDVRANEPTWRDLEQPIFQIFERDILCRYCEDELWKSYVEVDCFHEESRTQLHMNRRDRQMCSCHVKRIRKENKCNQTGPIFDNAAEEVVTHAPDDALDKLTISMKPDRVIGLLPWAKLPYDEIFFPISGRASLLLPFLVVEAKSETGGSGFRAIQHQTAFPIRRFLRAQTEVIGPDSACEPPLVWFFAYQGELWRLHACLRDDDKVKIYDLWQGTIQSQDGALQLLLLVDYIWSWARDIYRPTIMDLLAKSMNRSRDFSPASTDRFRYSISLSCATSPTPNSQEQDSMQLDQTMQDEEDNETSLDAYDMEHPPTIKRNVLEDASLNSMLLWAAGHHDAPSWTKLGSIRHADIVLFEVRYSEVTGVRTAKDTETLTDDPNASLDYPLSLVIHMLPAQIEVISKFWTSSAARFPTCEPDVRVVTNILFHTFCDHETWQIKRVLRFIILGTEPVSGLSTVESLVLTTNMPRASSIESNSKARTCDLADLYSALLDLQQIDGRQSVWHALRNKCLALKFDESNHLSWTTLEACRLPYRDVTLGITLTTPSEGDVYVGPLMSQYSGVGDLLRVRGDARRSTSTTLPELEQDPRNGRSMLAIRPSVWPGDSPQFCLFVLAKDFEYTEFALHQLLEEAILSKDFYGDPGYQWTKSASQALWNWRKALGYRKS